MARRKVQEELAARIKVEGATEYLKALQSMSDKSDAFVQKTRQAGLALGLVGAGMTAFSVSAIKAAASMERELKTLEALGGSARFAREQFAAFDKAAMESVFSLTELTGAGKMLVAFGMDAQKWLPTVDDLAAGMNKSLSETALVMGRLKSGNFGEAFERLREFGITRDLLEAKGLKFDKSGSYKGSVDDAMKAVKTIVKDRFGGLSKKIATETFEGALSNLGDAWGRFSRGLGDPALPTATAAVRGLTGALTSLNEQLPEAARSAILLAGPIASVGGGALTAAGQVAQLIVQIKLLRAMNAGTAAATGIAAGAGAGGAGVAAGAGAGWGARALAGAGGAGVAMLANPATVAALAAAAIVAGGLSIWQAINQHYQAEGIRGKARGAQEDAMNFSLRRLASVYGPDSPQYLAMKDAYLAKQPDRVGEFYRKRLAAGERAATPIGQMSDLDVAIDAARAAIRQDAGRTAYALQMAPVNSPQLRLLEQIADNTSELRDLRRIVIGGGSLADRGVSRTEVVRYRDSTGGTQRSGTSRNAVAWQVEMMKREGRV